MHVKVRQRTAVFLVACLFCLPCLLELLLREIDFECTGIFEAWAGNRHDEHTSFSGFVLRDFPSAERSQADQHASRHH